MVNRLSETEGRLGDDLIADIVIETTIWRIDIHSTCKRTLDQGRQPPHYSVPLRRYLGGGLLVWGALL